MVTISATRLRNARFERRLHFSETAIMTKSASSIMLKDPALGDHKALMRCPAAR